MSTGILIGIGAIVIVFAVIVGLYNALVRGKNMVEEAWSSIDVQLKRRHDLVPNLVSAVRQYASHEKALFEEVSAARARSLSVQGDVAAQAQQMGSVHLVVVAKSVSRPKQRVFDSLMQGPGLFFKKLMKGAFQQGFGRGAVRRRIVLALDAQVG